ncbi:thrombopoietin [Neoarius graeffei]|uniref:thrombopoietin n=1 Tax=Neoarius graeffei TaxID=443677 RepID=UPI00298C9A95|nr:thrombopoietin [Neoarius graeffei]
MEDDQGGSCFHTGVLCLLLGLVLTELSHLEAKPHDFVCVSEARKVMYKVKDLQEDLAQCSTAVFLPAPVRIPCIKVNIMNWKNKPIPERTAEILQSLAMLAQDIHNARNGSQADCALKLLGRFEHNIKNYIHTLTQLHSQNGLEGPKVPESPIQQVSQDLNQVLQQFDRLISRKLELLISEMVKECETKTAT